MSSRNVLITGGAGFLGTHLSRELLRRGCSVTVLDNFSPLVHGGQRALESDLQDKVRLIEGDVCNQDDWAHAIEGCDCVVHLAAETGTGRSMYDTAHYEQVNVGGTALLYDMLAKSEHVVDRIVVASSRAVYGEGAYLCAAHGAVFPASQPVTTKQTGSFDPTCPQCGAACTPAAVNESAPMQPVSFYGATKQKQEEMALERGRALGIATPALRLQNVYGPGQSLKNPYTGVLATFANRARLGEEIEIFEDGLVTRDFVFVADAVRALADSVTSDLQGQHAVNIGSGERTLLQDAAHTVNSFFGGKSAVRVSGAFREGDIRHALADITLAQQLLGYVPQTSFAQGLPQFLAWAATQNASRPEEHTRSLAEMREHGLLHG